MQDSENNTEQQRKLTNAFLSAGLAEGDVYQNRAGRYAILIWQFISKKPELKTLSNVLFDSVTTQLKENQIIVGLDTASKVALDKRAWYRYLYAYCSNVRAKGLFKQGNVREAQSLYKTAFDYSPDLTDRNHQSAYFYDAIFLIGEEKIPFQEDYLQFVMAGQGNKSETLKALLTVALTEPVYKGRLKEFYNANFASQEYFNSFWINSINAEAKDGPIFSLNRMDGSAFSTKDNKGKWALIDFWGTWCGPCRKEHPELQKFYQSVSNDPASRLVVMTIACRDTKAKVDSYMAENKYNFPVAMADNTVEKVCNIQGYPSKLLVTPQGKYLLIPYGTDWVNFVKGYSSL